MTNPMRSLTLFVLALAACKTSLPLSYRPPAPASAPTTMRIAVAPVVDKRGWTEHVVGDDAPWVVGLYGPRRFGVSFRGQDFAPVTTVVRELIIEHLRRSGIEAIPTEVAGASHVDAVLRLEIEQLEWLHRSAFGREINQRSVQLQAWLKMGNSSEQALAARRDTDESFFGKGHRENIDALFNRAFAPVAEELVNKISSMLAQHLGRAS
jgi:hypothetical protein